MNTRGLAIKLWVGVLELLQCGRAHRRCCFGNNVVISARIAAGRSATRSLGKVWRTCTMRGISACRSPGMWSAMARAKRLPRRVRQRPWRRSAGA